MHLQDGRGAIHLACKGGHVQLVKTLVEEFGMSPDVRDTVSILTVHELSRMYFMWWEVCKELLQVVTA